MTDQNKHKKRKILFVNDEMEMGGVARVLNTLMKNLDQQVYQIDLLVLHKTGTLLQDVPDGVHIIEGTPFFNAVDSPLKELLKKRDLSHLFSKLRLLLYMKTGLIRKKILKERKKMLSETYDVEMAAKEGFCTIFTAYGNSQRKVNWVLTDYSVCNYSANHMRLVKSALQRIDLNIADSAEATEAYKKVFGIKNVMTIHNLMNTEKVEKGMEMMDDLADIDPTQINIISVIRFHPQKAADRLLLAHQYVINQGIDHELYLIGGGEQEEMLLKMQKELKLTHVHFLGFKTNPYADIRACDLFVLPSLYEGFATVINESFIAGTPVLSTEVAGVHEQITAPHYGWIVENSQEGFNQGLLKALNSKEELQKMKQQLQEYHYPNDEIIRKFTEVL